MAPPTMNQSAVSTGSGLSSPKLMTLFLSRIERSQRSHFLNFFSSRSESSDSGFFQAILLRKKLLISLIFDIISPKTIKILILHDSKFLNFKNFRFYKIFSKILKKFKKFKKFQKFQKFQKNSKISKKKLKIPKKRPFRDQRGSPMFLGPSYFLFG